MGLLRLIRRFVKGEHLSAARMNELADGVNAVSRITGDGLIIVRQGMFGTTIGLSLASLLPRVPRVRESFGAMTDGAAVGGSSGLDRDTAGNLIFASDPPAITSLGLGVNGVYVLIDGTSIIRDGAGNLQTQGVTKAARVLLPGDSIEITDGLITAVNW